MPTTDAGKAIASRNATSHGLFTRDVVLPSLGEDPEGYQHLEDQWLAQLPPRTLLERHYVEKIAAASWRLRRLHRWQAQIFEDETLTEDERLTRLDKVLRHETALHRQIDTAVKMLAKDAPQLYAQRAREEVLAETRTAAREYHDNHDDAVYVDLKIQDKLYHTRQATEQAVSTLSQSSLDTAEVSPKVSPKISQAASSQPGGKQHMEKCQNELLHPRLGSSGLQPLVLRPSEDAGGLRASEFIPWYAETKQPWYEMDAEKCENELAQFFSDSRAK